jgi:dodecin
MADVPNGVVKIVELVGSSPDSFSDAVRNAVKVASETIRNIKGVDVLNSTAEVDGNGNIRTYKVHCKIAFMVESGAADGNGKRESVGAMSGGSPTRPASDS